MFDLRAELLRFVELLRLVIEVLLAVLLLPTGRVNKSQRKRPDFRP